MDRRRCGCESRRRAACARCRRPSAATPGRPESWARNRKRLCRRSPIRAPPSSPCCRLRSSATDIAARPANRRRSRRSARPPGRRSTSTWTPRASSALRRSADAAEVVTTSTSPCALRDQLANRAAGASCESSTMRSSGRLRGRAGAVGEQRIVGQRGADAGEDGVVIVAQLLHVGAGAFAGDPAAVVVGRGDFAVQRDGGLQRHQRPAGAHEVEERLVELGGFGGEFGGDFDFDAGVAQTAEAFAGNQRIGIFRWPPPRARRRLRSAHRRTAACGPGAQQGSRLT